MSVDSRTTFSSLFLGILSLLLTVSALAAPYVDGSQPVVRVGIYQNAPKLFLDSSGQPAGFFPEILQVIAEYERWQLEYVACEWQDCLYQVETGDLDLMMDVAYSEERAERFQFSQQAALTSWSIIYSRRNSSIYSLPDLHGQRVAVLAGSIQADLLAEQAQAFGIEPVFVPVDSFEVVFKLLAREQVDAGAVNHFYQVPLALKSRIRETSIAVSPSQLYFVAAPARTELLAAISRHLVSMKSDSNSAYAKAYRQWLQPTDLLFNPAVVRQAIAVATILILAVLGLLLLVWNRTLAWEVRRRRESETRLQTIASNIPGVVYSQILFPNGDDSITYISSGCWHFWGVGPEKIMADSDILWQSLTADERAAVQASIWQSARNRESWQYEWLVTTPQNTSKWMQVIGTPQLQKDGTVVVEGLIIDISDRKQAETELLASETRFRNMTANVPGAIFSYCLKPDGSEAILYMSPGCYDLWEVAASVAETNPQILWNMVLPEDKSGLDASLYSSAEHLTPWFWEWRIRPPSGKLKWLQGLGKPRRQSDGTIVWDVFIADATAHKHTEANLRASEARYRLLADNTSDLVCLHAPDGRYLYLSPSVKTLLGFTHEELVGSYPDSLLHPEDCDRIRQQSHLVALSGYETVPITFRMRTKSGHYIWMETLIKAIRDHSGQVIQLQSSSREVTERIKAQDKLRHEALHDSLTGLPNRTYFMERLRVVLDYSHMEESMGAAVLFLDLDRFKIINDSLGHLIGDQLLILVAQKLQSVLREGDLAARLGGDEFMVLVHELRDIRDAVRVAERLIDTLKTPFTIQDRQVFISPSIGIVKVSAHHHQTIDLLRDADLAMYQAKHRGGESYEIFDRSMHQEALERLNLENDLRRALDNHELYLVYQPIVELASGHLFGVESLLRWRHPRRGVILPSEFIPIAEETGLILPIGQWVIEQVCRQMQQWQQLTPSARAISICVNCSAKQLQSDDFLNWLEQQIQATELYSGQISLEITESLWIENLPTTVEKLNRLKQHDISLSIDDFGTGYSSLSYLSQLPIDILKIDRVFVSHLQERHLNQEIVVAILALSNPLGIRAVAEGIETYHQLQWLRKLGCELGQGDLFSRPQAPEAVLRWLQPAFHFDLAPEAE